MFNSKTRLWYILLIFIFLSTSLCLAVFSSFVYLNIKNSSNTLIIFYYILIITISFLGIYTAINNIKAVKINYNRQYILITYFWFYTVNINFKDLLAIKSFTQHTRYGVMQGFFIELADGKQVALIKNQFTNFDELKSRIKEVLVPRQGEK